MAITQKTLNTTYTKCQDSRVSCQHMALCPRSYSVLAPGELIAITLRLDHFLLFRRYACTCSIPTNHATGKSESQVTILPHHMVSATRKLFVKFHKQLFVHRSISSLNLKGKGNETKRNAENACICNADGCRVLPSKFTTFLTCVFFH